MPYDSGMNVFTPRTLGDLLALKGRKPEVTLFAGGTYLLHDDTRKYPNLPRTLASIGHIEELNRIHRTERYLEVGSCVSLSEIADIGGRVVPSILRQAIKTVATPPVRALATIGGNICVQEQRLTLFPVLFILDARCEFRELGSSRWAPISRLLGQDGSLDVAPTEVLTRVRIPLGDWSIHRHRGLSGGPSFSQWTLSFCGLANTERGVLSDFRFAFGSIGKNLLRNREIEAELVGRKLPLLTRERDTLNQTFNDYLDSSYSSLISTYQKSMASKLFMWFMSSLDMQ